MSREPGSSVGDDSIAWGGMGIQTDITQDVAAFRFSSPASGLLLSSAIQSISALACRKLFIEIRKLVTYRSYLCQWDAAITDGYMQIGNERAPIQLAQCWFTRLAISDAKM